VILLIAMLAPTCALNDWLRDTIGIAKRLNGHALLITLDLTILLPNDFSAGGIN
jgi:hypothetical protein